MPRNSKDRDNLEDRIEPTEEELVERFAKLFGHKPNSKLTSVKNITKLNNSIIDLNLNKSNLTNTNNSQYKLPMGKELDDEEIEKFLTSESLDDSILIDCDNQKKLDKVVTKFLGEDFTALNGDLDENDDVTNLIKELQDDINLESKYKDSSNELKEMKEQDFNELEKRHKKLKEFKINENISTEKYNKNNTKSNADSLDSPLKPIDLSEFGLNDDGDDPNTWCCICNEDAIIKCKDCDGDLYCQLCFNEGHSDYDMKRHKFEKYKRHTI